MLTPRFDLNQDDNFLIVTIYAPFTNISDTEIFMEDLDFRFFSKPYFLRLHLPKPIEESDLANAEYKADINSFVIKAPKKNSGEFFPGLDMLSELLKPKGCQNIQEPIEEFDENGELVEDIDCYFEQKISDDPTQEASTSDSIDNSYGFGFSRSNVFNRLLEECQEILEIRDLDSKPLDERKKERKEIEENAFNEDHYLADTFETNDELEYILKLESKWNDDTKLTKEDKQRMVDLGTQKKSQIKIEKENILSTSLGLLDILFAYCYDFRTTDWEHNSESAWAISKLCATLSCGDKYSRLDDCVIACVRRSLCFPLYRNWELSLVVWNDVCKLLKNSGKRGILKALLTIITIFLKSEGYYLYNQMYIDDYVLWCQSLSDNWLRKCLKSLQACLDKLNKDHIGLNIDKLDSYAKEIIMQKSKEEANNADVDLLEKVANLHINEDKVDSDDSDEEYESDSSSGDTSESNSDSKSESGSNSESESGSNSESESTGHNPSTNSMHQANESVSIVRQTSRNENVIK